MSDWTVDTLKECLEKQLQSQANLQEARSAAIEKEAREAVCAQAKLNATIVASQEKAITKAEDAQREYNIRSNEFRGQLDDQNKMQMPRTEATTRFETVDARHLELRDAMEAKIEAVRKDFEKSTEQARTEMYQLRGQLTAQTSETGGRTVGQRSTREIIAWIIAITMFLLTAWDKIFKG